MPGQRGAWVTALIVVPRTYNADSFGRRRRVERWKFNATAREITERFGGCTFHAEAQRGYWASRGLVFEDEVALIEVDLPDTDEDRRWLLDYVQKDLLSRFEQEAMYVKFVRLIDVHTVEVSN